MAEINALDRVVAECAREIAAQDASSDFAALIRIIDAQAAEIERLRAALAKARECLSCGMWDYGPGQSEHDQCDALIGEIDAILGDQE